MRGSRVMTFANVGYLLLGLIGTLLALMGLLSAVKGTPVCTVDALGGGPLPEVRDPAFRAGMELVTRAPLVPGHEVAIYSNGDETYPPLWKDLRGAQKSITMQMYYCEPGRMADMLKEILVERARAGVLVLFLYDAFGTSFKKEYVAELKAAGVRAEPFRPMRVLAAQKIQHRAHIRVVCVDATIGYTGGFGIDDKWFGNGRDKGQWRDSNVRFTGPAVSQLQAAFVACWAETTGMLEVGPMMFPPASGNGEGKAEGGIVAAVLHGSPSVGSTESERFFALSIASARERLYITNSYFVPDKEFRELIADAARRGVDTRILTAGDASDVMSTVYASRARYEELLSAGVRIYEYRNTMMHAKTLVVDGIWGAVGSMNADNRSLSLNEETVMMMLDEGIGASLERHFMDDLEHSDEIDLETFRQRGMFARLKEHAWHVPWRVL